MPGDAPHPPPLTLWVLRIWALVLLVPLAGYALLGWFSRYASDDYCTAGITLTNGFFSAQEYWYRAWSGRYTFTAIVSAFEVLGSNVVQIVPAISLLVWLAVTTWACLPLARLSRWRFPRLTALVAAEIIAFSTLTAAPNIGQSFYMQAGMVTYTFPLIFLTLYAGWVVRVVLASDVGGLSLTAIGASGLAMLLIGGLNETTATTYTACLGLAGLVGLIALRGNRRRVLFWLMASGVVGLVVATVLMGVAPGTRIRLAQEGDPGFSLARVPLASGASLQLAIAVARRFEALSRPDFVFAFLLPLVVGWASLASPVLARSSGPRAVMTELLYAVLVVMIFGLALGLMALSLFPSYIVQGFDPPARIQQITDFFLVLGLAAAGYIIGRRLAHWTDELRRLPLARAVVGVGLVMLAVVPLRVALNVFGQVPIESAYAADWDRIDQYLRTAEPPAGGVVTTSPLPPRWDWAFIDQEPGDFPNVCVARFYSLPAVVSDGPAPLWTGAAEPGGRLPGTAGR